MKRVVFASGKGGAGKTTLTALIAHLAAPERLVTVADCDVEASNLSIALAARQSACEPFAGMPRASIDPALCRGCGLCADVCRFGAIRPGDVRKRPAAYAVDRWSCEGCRACVSACPADAIAMIPSEAGEVCDGATVAGPIAYGRLAPGEDLSGKLVTEVRSHAEVAAAAWGADLLLIDGPPGVGCPATASITNTDLLVAVAEPTLASVHDLLRLLTLARRLGVPVVSVLNKADLSSEMAVRVRETLGSEGVALLGEVPYDPSVSGVLDRLASCRARANPSGPAYEAAMAIWRELAARLA